MIQSTDAIVADQLPQPRRIAFDAPWGWLAAGWRDLWRRPSVGITYGAITALTAALLCASMALIEALPLFLTLVGGFLLLGPLFAVGLYEASRRMALGEPVAFMDVVSAPAAARGQLALAGAFLLLMFFLWLRTAMLMFMLFLGTNAIPPPSEFFQMLLFTPHGLGLLVCGTLVGAVFAAIVFVTSATSIPLLLFKRTDVLTAAAASVEAVRTNPKPMALWALLIVVIMAAGFATLLFGLLLAFPLIGHATWHAYEEIYGSVSDVANPVAPS